jgi:large subunit ribosomal protein L25
MQIEVIAQERDGQGTGASRRLRHAGFVPGIVYGGNKDPLAIQLDHNALFHALRKEAFHSSVLNLKVGNMTEMALLRDIQMHPYKPQILHVDFQRVDANHKIHVKVPLHFINEDTAPGVKLTHGLVNHVMTELDVACLPGNLPEFIEVDLGMLEAGQSIHVNDLNLPAGVEPVAHLKAENPSVVGITPPKGGAVEGEAPSAPAA